MSVEKLPDVDILAVPMGSPTIVDDLKDVAIPGTVDTHFQAESSAFWASASDFDASRRDCIASSLDGHIPNIIDTLNVLGRWVNVTDERICRLFHLCLFGDKVVWQQPPRGLQNSSEVCDLLIRNRRTDVHFIGDSIVRHMYMATLLLLSDDYERGAIDSVFCKGDVGFTDVFCRYLIRASTLVCGGRVTVSYHPSQHTEARQCSRTLCSDESLVFWSEGAHPIHFDYKSAHGTYNASEYFFNRILPSEICRDPR